MEAASSGYVQVEYEEIDIKARAVIIRTIKTVFVLFVVLRTV